MKYWRTLAFKTWRGFHDWIVHFRTGYFRFSPNFVPFSLKKALKVKLIEKDLQLVV